MYCFMPWKQGCVIIGAVYITAGEIESRNGWIISEKWTTSCLSFKKLHLTSWKTVINTVIPSPGPWHMLSYRAAVYFCSLPECRANIDITRKIYFSYSCVWLQKIVHLSDVLKTEDDGGVGPEGQRTKGFFLNSIYRTNNQEGENIYFIGKMPIDVLTEASIYQSAVQLQFEEGTQTHCFPTGTSSSVMLGCSFPFISNTH